MKKLFLSFILIIGLCSIVYGSDQWDKTKFADTTLIPDAPGLMRVNNEALDRILPNYSGRANVSFSSTTTVIVSAGSTVSSNSGGTIRRLRTNTSSTNVTFANIDTGAEASSTTYYVYSVADTDTTTFTIEISTSSSAPSGATFYKKLGSFFNDSSSNIDRRKVYTNAYDNAVNDSSGIPKITAIYNYATSASSFTAKESDLKFAFGQQSVGANSTTTISNLPFTGSATYNCWATFDQNLTNDDGYAGCTPASSSTLTIINQQGGGTRTIQWGAIGY